MTHACPDKSQLALPALYIFMYKINMYTSHLMNFGHVFQAYIPKSMNWEVVGSFKLYITSINLILLGDLLCCVTFIHESYTISRRMIWSPSALIEFWKTSSHMSIKLCYPKFEDFLVNRVMGGHTSVGAIFNPSKAFTCESNQPHLHPHIQLNQSHLHPYHHIPTQVWN